MAATLSPTLQITPGAKLLPVAKALEILTGNRPHPTTVCRWCRRGAAGLMLPSLIVSGRRMTTVEALDAWLREVTDRRNAL